MYTFFPPPSFLNVYRINSKRYYFNPQNRRHRLRANQSECKVSQRKCKKFVFMQLLHLKDTQKSEITKDSSFYIIPIFLAKSKIFFSKSLSINNYLYLCRVKCLKITIMATQVLQFNQAQQAVLNVISCLQSEQDLADLKRTLVKFMNDACSEKWISFGNLAK